MNIFGSETGFLGSPLAPHNTAQKWGAFMAQAQVLRAKLGARSKLADNYMRALFAPLSSIYLPDSAVDGFDSVGNLRGFCLELIEGRKPRSIDPDFDRHATVVLRDRLSQFKETTTKLTLLQCALFPAYIDIVAPRFYEELKQDIAERNDFPRLRVMYDKIAEILDGDTELKLLNTAFKEAFCELSYMSIYSQAATNGSIDMFSERNKETGKSYLELYFNLVS